MTIEIVERLHGVAVSIGMEWTAEHRQHVFDTVKEAAAKHLYRDREYGTEDIITSAASLLLALDAERGALSHDLHKTQFELDEEFRRAERYKKKIDSLTAALAARSTLPDQDKGGE